MNRPKKHKSSKSPLHPFPLARTADLEARRTEERGVATALPLIWTQGLWVIILISTIAASIHLKIHTGPAATNSLLGSESVSSAAQLVWNVVLTSAPGLTIYLVIHWWLVRRLGRRWVKKTAVELDSPGLVVLFIAIAAIFLVLVSGLTSVSVSAVVLSSFLATYLLITGIRRRVGRDPRCANCAYPEPNPNTPLQTCPECGTDRADPLAIILGRNTRSPARIITALALLAGATTLFMLR